MKYLIIFYTISFISTGYSQDFSFYGSSLTPNGTVHVLIVFVGFDTTTVSDNSSTWKHDSIPSWARGSYNNIIDIDGNQIHSIRNVTSYFNYMSNGQFNITGEIYPDFVRVPPSYTIIYDSLGNIIFQSINTSNVLKAARDAVNLQDNGSFNYDYSRFDNRTNFPDYKFDNSIYSNVSGDTVAPDGKIDYIVFAVRDFGKGANGASTPGVSGSLFFDTIPFQIDKGHRHTACEDSYTSFNQVFIHEMMHTIYGAPHTWGVNGVVGDFRLSRVTVTGPGAVSLQLLNTALI